MIIGLFLQVILSLVCLVLIAFLVVYGCTIASNGKTSLPRYILRCVIIVLGLVSVMYLFNTTSINFWGEFHALSESIDKKETLEATFLMFTLGAVGATLINANRSKTKG